MSHEHDHDHQRRRGAGGGASDATAPGKRARTDRLPPRPAGGGSLRGHERDVATLDGGSDYRESRATVDAPVRDPLDFLDEEARARPPRRRGKRHGHARGGHGGAAGGGHEPPDGPAAAPRKLLGDITHHEPAGDGAMPTRVVVGVGTAHGVTDGATFQLCHPDGRPYGSAELVPLERQRITTALGCSLADDRIAPGTRVLVTIPAEAAPDLRPDGSIGPDGPDDAFRLEA